jgi:hypothetical protein
VVVANAFDINLIKLEVEIQLKDMINKFSNKNLSNCRNKLCQYLLKLEKIQRKLKINKWSNKTSSHRKDSKLSNKTFLNLNSQFYKQESHSQSSNNFGHNSHK